MEKVFNDYIKDNSVSITRNGYTTEISDEFLEAMFQRNLKKNK